MPRLVPSCDARDPSPPAISLRSKCPFLPRRSPKRDTVVYTCDSRASLSFSSSLPLPFRPGRLSFRRAREPLISADFARRADPWNPRGYLSPGGSFLSFSLSPFLPLPLLSYPSSPVPSEFFTRGFLTAPRLFAARFGSCLLFSLEFCVTAPFRRVISLRLLLLGPATARSFLRLSLYLDMFINFLHRQRLLKPDESYCIHKIKYE